MGLPLLQDSPTQESWQDSLSSLEATPHEAAQASWDSAIGTSGFSGLTDTMMGMSERQRLQSLDSPVLQPSELNSKYGAEGIHFKEATSAAVAEQIVARRRKQMEDEKTIAMGPDGITQWLRNEANSITSGMVHDPAGFGLYAAADLLAAPVAGAVGIGKALLAPGIRGVLAKNAVVGLIAGAVETPINEIAKHQEQHDVSAGGVIEDYLSSAASNALFATSMHYGFEGAKLMKNMGWNWLSGSADRASRDAINLAIDQAFANKRPDTSVISSLLDRERASAAPRDGVVDYSGRMENRGSVSPDGQANGKFFWGTNATTEDFHAVDNSTIKPFEKNYGDGYYVTDDAVRANNFSASKFNDVQGNIFETNVTNANLIHDNAPIPGNVFTKVKSILLDAADSPQIREAISKELENGASIGDVFDSIHEMADPADAKKIIDAVNKEVKAAGYDGYAINADGKRNDIMLFDKAKIEPGQTFTPDKRLLPDSEKIDPAIQANYDASMKSKESNVLYDPRLDKAAQDLKAKALAKDYDNLKDPELDNELKSTLDEIKQNMDKLTPEEKDLVAQMSETTKVDKGVGAKDVVDQTGKEATIADQVKAHEAAIKSAIPCVGA